MTVLSIQSHVVSGHVGNTAAVFCLERLGIDTWGLNTLQFSNHTGLAGYTGRIFPAEHIEELVAGLKKYQDLSACEAVLSGYLGSAETGRIVLETVDLVRKYNPKAMYCCDPVMGDVGRGVYVRPEIPDFMKTKAALEADILFPNHFELELLTDRTATTREEAVAAARQLLSKGKAKLVVVTSFLEQEPSSAELSVLCVSKDEAYAVTTPRLALDFPVVGSGDMMSSLFLGYFLKTNDIRKTLSMSVSALFGVLDETLKNKKNDIQLIKAQNQLVEPSKIFEAKKI